MSFLQVASWNIEHLGGSPRATRKQSAFALADHIEMSGADVIALQEVYLTPYDEEVRLSEKQPPIESSAKTNRRNSDLDVVCHVLEEHLDAPWAYYIAPNRQDGDRSQLCAMMWNTKRLTLDGVEALSVKHKDQSDNLWDRKPHLFSFSSDIDVWRKSDDGAWRRLKEKRRLSVVPLHMKSNFDGVTQNRRVREKEAATLCAAIGKIRKKIDPTIILIGDTNVLDSAEPAIEVFIDSGFVDLNNYDGETYWSAQHKGAPFDRAFVAADRPEFRYTRQYVLQSADRTAHDRFLSDHYMIKISVKDYVDESDPR